MLIDLSGATAIITGSTKGIGFETAKMLLGAGASVVVNGRSEPGVAEALRALNGLGPVRGVVADIGTAVGCAKLIEAEPSCDILVNNAFFAHWASLYETDEDAWENSWQTNVMACVRLSRHYLPGMGERSWGRVVLVSSEAARNVHPQLVAYGVTKLAMHALSRSLAKQMSGTGVTVNTVVPGPTLSAGMTEMLEPEARSQGITLHQAASQFVESFRPSSLTRRMATAEEVASLITYVCSRLAASTTGAALRCDGGVIDDVN